MKNLKKKDKYVRTEDVRNENKKKQDESKLRGAWGEKDVVCKTLRETNYFCFIVWYL